MKRDRLGRRRRWARRSTTAEIPARRCATTPRPRARAMIEAIAEVDDEVMARTSTGASCRPRRSARGAAPRDASPAAPCRCCRRGVQEQGRAAAARRGGRLPAVAGRRPAGRGHGPGGGRPTTRKADDDEPFSALAFKIMNDTVRRSADLLPRLLGQARRRARPSTTRPRASASASAASCACTPTSARTSRRSTRGNIAAAVGLRVTTTGDTLCDEKAPIVLEPMEFPDAGHLASRSSRRPRPTRRSWAMALAEARRRGPVVPRARPTPRPARPSSPAWASCTSRSSSTGWSASSRSRRTSASPQVAYRETIAREADGEGKYIRQTGGRGAVRPRPARTSSPADRARAIVFENATVGGAIPHEYVPRSRRACARRCARRARRLPADRRRACSSIGGSYHEVDSSEKAFEIAGSMGVQAAAREAGPVLLEPVMEVEVVTPDEYMGDVIGEPVRAPRPRRRHGGARHRRRRSRAEVPLATHVRLLDRRAVDDPGPRDLHDAVFALRTGPDARDRVDRRAHAGRLLKVRRAERQERTTAWPKKNSSATSRT